MKRFNAPTSWLGDLDAEAVATLIAAAADVALVIDGKGTIRDMAFGNEELMGDFSRAWLNRPWIDTVTIESRSKVTDLLAAAGGPDPPRWRHVNHPIPRAPDLPILYMTIRLDAADRIIAVGRDLRAAAALQQRLVEAQLALERDYTRLRHVEARYRLLFEMTEEAVLILDATTQKVLEANPAASRLLGETKRGAGRTFPDGFDAPSVAGVQALLARVRVTGQTGDARARLVGSADDVLVTAFLFRQDMATLFLVRLTRLGGVMAPAVGSARFKLLEAAERVPDGIVVTEPDGRIIAANAAFLDLAQLASEEQARGQSLDRWLGRPGIDLDVLLANLRQHGSLKLFATTFRGEYGTTAEVELSAVAVAGSERTSLGFTIRNVGRRLTAEPRPVRDLPRSVEQLTELVGRVPLKDLVRETTDVIERLCIEAALELTGDNRASAAELLGLSRQSLYVKLRRYGLGELGANLED